MSDNTYKSNMILVSLYMLIATTIGVVEAQDTASGFTGARPASKEPKPSVRIGSQRTAEKKQSFVTAKPTQTTEKSSVTIGQQRIEAPAETAATETTKKKSTLKSALKVAKQAAPAVIEYAPALVESGKKIAATLSESPTTTQPNADKPLAKPSASQEKEDEQEESNETEEEENDDVYDNYEYLNK